MRELVMIVTDLYLAQAAAGLRAKVDGANAAMPGIEHVSRFGTRTRLPGGWRDWLARWLGREDLAQAAPARVAAALLAEPAAATGTGTAAATRWIATPVQLVAGLSSVHLGQHGIVRLTPAERTALCAGFARTFAESDLGLRPLSGGDFLMETPGIAPLATLEPARCLGAEIGPYVPRGAAARELLQLTGEIEMWLHGEPVNAARRASGVPPVTQLWLWGSAGGATPAPAAVAAPEVAFGEDAFLAGLWHLQRAPRRPLPQSLDPLLEPGGAARMVLSVEAGWEVAGDSGWQLEAALAALDERFVSPALRALEAGPLGRFSLVANDTLVSLTRRSSLRRWRRRRAPLAAFA